MSLWNRRERADEVVRMSIGSDERLNVFGVGFTSPDEGREAFVTITARDEAAREAARDLLADVAVADWDAWRRLQLGDWMLRVYPERLS